VKIKTYRILKTKWIIFDSIGVYANHDELKTFDLGCTRMVTMKLTEFGWRT